MIEGSQDGGTETGMKGTGAVHVLVDQRVISGTDHDPMVLGGKGVQRGKGRLRALDLREGLPWMRDECNAVESQGKKVMYSEEGAQMGAGAPATSEGRLVR